MSTTSILTKYKEKFFKKLFENFHGILLFSAGSALLLYGAYHAYHHFVILRNKTLYETHLLHRKITSLYSKYKNLVFLKIEKKELIEDPSGVIFEVSLLENLKNKPNFQQNLKKADTFLPPFEDGQFICEITNTHNLLFNKFAMVKYHVLITTKHAEPQQTQLNFHDFLATVKTMRALEGLCFFNSGEGSGFSVQHKHLQVIPYRNCPNYGVFELIKERIKEKSLVGCSEEGTYLLKEFKFRHAIRVFDSNNEESFEKSAENLLINYQKALETLENNDVKIPYNVIFTDDWLLMVLREKEYALETIGLNSMAFSGSIVVKDEKEYEKVVNLRSPFKILEEISLH